MNRKYQGQCILSWWLPFFLALFLVAGSAWSQVQIQVEVKGVKGKALKNVMAYLSIAHQKETPPLTEEQIRQLHDKAPDEIKTALKVYGYYQAQVQAELKKRPEKWLAHYRIEPGSRMKVARVNLKITGEGAEDPAFQKLRQDFPVKQGAPLNQAHYEEGKDALQQLAAERGYFQAKLIQRELRINLKGYSATAVLHFETGSRYRFGAVTFTDTVLRPQLLTRYVPFKEGEPYKASSLLELQTALIDSDYFAEVEVEPQPQHAVDDKVPISVRLEPKKRHRYSVGVGYGTNSGPRINLGWENRYINRRGHRFSLAVKASKIDQSFNASYVIPIRDPRTDQFRVDSSFGRQSTRTSKSRIALLGARRITTRADGWRETLFLDYRWENFDIGGESDTANLLIPGVTWSRNRADNFVYPHRGSRISLALQGATEPLLSNSSFAQLTLRGKIIRSLGSRSRLLIRGDAGVTWASDFSKLPPSIRYFAGGDHSIRGYGFYSLGARNDKGRIVGGKNLLVGSMEYEYRVFDKWAIAAFYDAGNAFNGFSLDVKQGVGVGLRWISPVGPIRVDFALALSKPGTPFRFHVYLGPDL